MLTSPVVEEVIPNGKAVITGQRSIEEAQQLAILLRSGSLPVKVEVLETRTVGPTLVFQAEKSVCLYCRRRRRCALYGIFYRIPGMVANVALILYVLMLLLALKLLNATLTLPGIAGHHLVCRYGG